MKASHSTLGGMRNGSVVSYLRAEMPSHLRLKCGGKNSERVIAGYVGLHQTTRKSN